MIEKLKLFLIQNYTYLVSNTNSKQTNLTKYNLIILIISSIFSLFHYLYISNLMSISCLIFSFFSFIINIYQVYYNTEFKKSVITLYYVLSIITLFLQASSIYHMYPLYTLWYLVVISLSTFFFDIKKSIVLSLIMFLALILTPLLNSFLCINFKIQSYFYPYQYWIYMVIVSTPFFLIVATFFHYVQIVRYENESLLKLQSFKETFYAQLSHEIRTPLNSIIGLSKILENNKLPEPNHKYAETIHAASNNLMQLLNDILIISKIHEGNSIINQTKFNLKEDIDQMISMVENHIIQKKLDLEFRFDSNIEHQIIGDKTRLNQIINNLLYNAIQFTLKGEILLVVELIGKDKKFQEIKFTIKDTGIGMSEAFQKIVFEEFSQENRLDLNKNGTGLGLSICHKLVQLMGGQLQFESNINSGSTFYFSLIFEISKDHEDFKKNDTNVSIDHIKKLNNKSILVVDDSMSNRLLCRAILEPYKCHILEANNGKEAIEIIQKTKEIHCIIMDLSMPIMSGIEASKIIRNQLKLNIPIIAFTANVVEDLQKDIEEAGMNDYLIKPCSHDDLLERIINLI